MPKHLSNDQVRITVRLPLALYEDLVGVHRRYRYTSTGYISDVVRRALRHFLNCPDLRRAEADARAAFEEQVANVEASMAMHEGSGRSTSC